MSKPTVGYWDIRGLGQPIRLMLTYAGQDFHDKRYNIGPAPTFDRSEWLNEKFNLGLDFPNLPYYIDGDLKMTQTLAILRYLGHKHNMEGKTEHERVRVAMLEQQTHDMFWQFARMCYDENMEKLRADLMAKLPETFKLLSKFMGDHHFVAGTYVTYVDFFFYEYLLRIKVLMPEIFNQFDNLKQYVERFESLLRVSEYIKQQQPKTFNAPMAKLNGSYA
uniref:Glutathione S-transferase n=1 Tax=Psoroptes ovis TaxID=83912 RepID=A0A3B0QJN7_PSOOV|nr:Group 8 mite allergen-like protein (mu class glutathione transferase) [Psoroptes ovis]